MTPLLLKSVALNNIKSSNYLSNMIYKIRLRNSSTNNEYFKWINKRNFLKINLKFQRLGHVKLHNTFHLTPICF